MFEVRGPSGARSWYEDVYLKTVPGAEPLAEPLVAAASSPASTPEAVTSFPVASVAMPEAANPAPASNTSSAVDASLPVPNAQGAAPSWSRNPARGWLRGLSTLEDWEAAPEATHYKTVFETLREELQCALLFSDVRSVLFRPDRDGQLRLFRAVLEHKCALYRFSDTHACIMAWDESKKAVDFLDHWYRALLAEHGDDVHVRTSCFHVQGGVQKGEKDIPYDSPTTTRLLSGGLFS